MINQENAFNLLKEHLKTENLIRHSLAVAVVMKRLAKHFHENEEEWYLAGLLHDIDYDQTYDNPEKHGILAMDILNQQDVTPEIKQAIRAHSGNFPVVSLMDKALWTADPVTGLITASALMNPEKKISVIKQNSLMKKYKNKNFAAGANREQIAYCEEIAIPLSDFLQMATEAMAEIEEQLL